jgi:regulator of protease activity HflC (stomatin/prohibitin superfamily)
MFVAVPLAHAFVVERMGKYHRTLAPGFHLVIPGLDKVAARYSLAPQTVPLALTCPTKDPQTVRVEGALEYRIVDPARVRYAVADPVKFATELAANQAQKAVAKRSLKEVRVETREVETEIVSGAREATSAAPVGIEITSCRLARIDIPARIA